MGPSRCGGLFLRREAQIATERLCLEPLTVEHSALLFPLLCDSNLYTYLPIDPPKSLDELTQRFMRISRGLSPDGEEEWLNWVVRIKNPSQDCVGTVQATVLKSGVAMIAYVIFPQYWRLGLAQEAVRGMLKFLFRSCGVTLAEALIDTRNVRSVHVVESIGFVRNEIILDADVFKGSHSDEYRYILVSEQISI